MSAPICATCGKALTTLLGGPCGGPCGGCGKTVCFQCETFTAPGASGQSFCGECAYPCAVDDCGEIIWPRSFFTRAGDTGRVPCTICEKRVANTCAQHDSGDAPQRCPGGVGYDKAPPCDKFVCQRCRYGIFGQRRACREHTRPCARCRRETEEWNMVMCDAEGCNLLFCRRLSCVVPAEDSPETLECQEQALGYDARTGTYKCHLHLAHCSVCKHNVEPVRTLHSTFVRAHTRLCTWCVANTAARVDAFDATLRPDERAQFPDEIKRLIAAHLITAQADDQEKRNLNLVQRSVPKKYKKARFVF